jgi:hypothetical protein
MKKTIRLLGIILVILQIIIALFFTDYQSYKYSSEIFLLSLCMANVISYLLLFLIIKKEFKYKENILVSLIIFLFLLLIFYFVSQLFFMLFFLSIALNITAIILFCINQIKTLHSKKRISSISWFIFTSLGCVIRCNI